MLQSLLPYGFLLAIFVAIVLFVISQLQRRKDKAEDRGQRKYNLPLFTEGIVDELRRQVPNIFPEQVSGLMLCEYQDGKFDVAVGLKGIPIFVLSDSKNIKKLVDLDNGVERKFTVIETKSGCSGLIVFDENGRALIGRFNVVSADKLRKENFRALQVKEDGHIKEVSVKMKFRSSMNLLTFELRDNPANYASTTPIFLSKDEFLGFASYLVPAIYKNSSVSNSDDRELIQQSYRFGVVAEKLLKNGIINLTYDTAHLKVINNAKNQ